MMLNLKKMPKNYFDVKISKFKKKLTLKLRYAPSKKIMLLNYLKNYSSIFPNLKISVTRSKQKKHFRSPLITFARLSNFVIK